MLQVNYVQLNCVAQIARRRAHWDLELCLPLDLFMFSEWHDL